MRPFRLMMSIQTLWPLMWGTVLLVILLFIFALVMTQIVGDGISHLTTEQRTNLPSEILEWYGTVPETMLTLLKAVTHGEAWSRLLQPLIIVSPTLSPAVFLAYVIVMTYGITNVITAVQVDGVVYQSNRLREASLAHHAQQDSRKLEILKDLLKSGDVLGNGRISPGSFARLLQVDEVVKVLDRLEMDVGGAMTLFAMLEDGGTIDIDEFAHGIVYLQSSTSTLQLATLMRRGQQLLRKVKDFSESFQSFEQRVTVDRPEEEEPM